MQDEATGGFRQGNDTTHLWDKKCLGRKVKEPGIWLALDKRFFFPSFPSPCATVYKTLENHALFLRLHFRKRKVGFSASQPISCYLLAPQEKFEKIPMPRMGCATYLDIQVPLIWGGGPEPVLFFGFFFF